MITLCWKRVTKKANRFSTPGHHVVLRLGEPNALLHSYAATNASWLERWGPSFNFWSFWAFSDAMAYSNRDRSEVTIFRFHRIGDFITVGNHRFISNIVFLVRSWDCNRYPCLGKSLGMRIDSALTWLQTQRQRAPLNPFPAVKIWFRNIFAIFSVDLNKTLESAIGPLQKKR